MRIARDGKPAAVRPRGRPPKKWAESWESSSTETWGTVKKNRLIAYNKRKRRRRTKHINSIFLKIDNATGYRGIDKKRISPKTFETLISFFFTLIYEKNTNLYKTILKNVIEIKRIRRNSPFINSNLWNLKKKKKMKKKGCFR